MTVPLAAAPGPAEPGASPMLQASDSGALSPGVLPLILVLALGLIAAGREAASGPEPGLARPVLRVDPSTASPALLSALPRLGPALVGRIVAARQLAPFRSAEDLDRRVPGIGPKTIAALRPYLLLSPTDAALDHDR